MEPTRIGYISISRCTRYALALGFMKESAAISMLSGASVPGSRRAGDGSLCPKNTDFFGTPEGGSGVDDGHMVPKLPREGLRACLDGNFARRKLPPSPREYCIWDTALKGFGLRVRPSGKRTWFVRLRLRGKQQRVSLGDVGAIDAQTARMEARRHLAKAALDGLPKRTTAKAAPLLSDYFDEFWADCARNWKPLTQVRNMQAWVREIMPAFGGVPVDAITTKDIHRWRDSFAGPREGTYNRTVPVFSAIMAHAEVLGYRKKRSNPCRGLPRYKREPKERFLAPHEYRRLGAVLREDEAAHPLHVAAVRLLLLTGARAGEIVTLQWDWIKPPRLDLPDSKTGPRTILLNSQALDILAAIPRRKDCAHVFPSRVPGTPITLGPWWEPIRRRAGIADVRIHDLRHSFASSAIMANVPLDTVGRILGHGHVESTAKYAHLSDDVIADAAARVSGGLAQKLGLAS
jgi:integrase